MRLSRTVTASNRAELVRAVEAAPLGAQFDLIDAPRTSQQNRLLWPLLSAFAEQVEHCGNKYDPEIWKCILLKAFGHELQFVPDLSGLGVAAIGYRSSQLSKEEMSNFIEFIFSEGAKRGVVFHGEAA
jgi:hypothetical protein